MNKINWGVRLKNKVFWLSLIPAVILLIQAVASLFGLVLELGDVGNKLVDIKLVNNVTIGANAVLNKDLEVSLESGSKYKIFVVDSESGISPVSKDMEIEIK